MHLRSENFILVKCIRFMWGDHLWYTMDGPKLTVHSAVDGKGGPSAVVTDSPGEGQIIGGTIRSVTVRMYPTRINSCLRSDLWPFI